MAGRAVFASAFALLAAVTSCEHAPPERARGAVETGEVRDGIVSAGMERLIPIRAVMMVAAADGTACNACNSAVPPCAGDPSPCNPSKACSPDPVSLADYQREIDRANAWFLPSGVHFYLESVERYSAPKLRADPGDFSQMSVAWSEVRSEIRQLLPNTPCAPFPTGLTLLDPFQWLTRASTYYAPKHSIPLFVSTGFKGGWGDYPHRNRIYMSGASMWTAPATDNSQNVPHELGHFLGLPHPYQPTIPSGDAGSTVAGGGWHLERASLRDPETGSYANFADFWDLTFAPGTPNTYPTSRAAAVPVEPSLVGKERACPGGPAGCDTCSVATDGTITCVMGAETASTGDPRMVGMAITHQGDPGTPNLRGVNMMSYLGNTTGLWYGISASQIRWIQKNLRYDIQITDQANFQGQTGSRPFLGLRGDRPATVPMDFNGDTRRDIGWYTPPKAASGDGEWFLLMSPGFPGGSAVSVVFGKLGDTPVALDCNGDGKTDLALYRTGGQNGTSVTDTSAWWTCCTAPSFNCTSPMLTQFGERGDVPLSGTDFDGNGIRNEVAVFRPSTNTVYWRTFTGGSQPPITFPGSGFGKTPSVDLYDADAKSDVSLWDPTTATYTLASSTAGYATAQYVMPSLLIPQGSGSAAQRSGAVISAGNYSFTTSWRRTFQAWSPNDGVWWTWPQSAGYASPCQWGLTDDVPLTGSSDFVAAYRPGNGTIHVLLHPCNYGTQYSVSHASWGHRTVVAPVADLNGDYQSDFLIWDADKKGLWTWDMVAAPISRGTFANLGVRAQML